MSKWIKLIKATNGKFINLKEEIESARNIIEEYGDMQEDTPQEFQDICEKIGKMIISFGSDIQEDYIKKELKTIGRNFISNASVSAQDFEDCISDLELDLDDLGIELIY